MSAEPVPPPPLDDPIAWPIASALLMCVCSELVASPGGEVCSCALVPGQIVPMDWCGCDDDACGMAWVRVDAIFPSDQFPVPVGIPRGCDGPYAVRFHAGVFRCLPTLDSSGQPPSAAEQTEATRIALGDQFAVLRGIKCCPALPKRLLLGQWTPVSAGDCGGGFWPVTVQAV